MSVKILAKKIAVHIPAAKRAAVRVRDRIGVRRYQKQYANRIRTDVKQVVFTAYSGRQYACSPKALYEKMLSMEEYAQYHFTWAFLRPEDFAFLKERPRTTVVRYRSEEYYKAMAAAGTWISNTRVPSEVWPKEDQLYVQTWHGTPFKKLGYDVTNYIHGADDKKSLRYSYLTDARRMGMLLSPSPYYTEHMVTAFHLDALGKASIVLEKGYPRNDSLYTATEEDVARIREQLGVAGKKVILYAPTWRENLHPETGHGYAEGMEFNMGWDVNAWEDYLVSQGEDPGEYAVLLRTHYFDVAGEDIFCHAMLKDVSEYPEINDLYLAADVLLTDYSSVFYDYKILQKPAVFYLYDLEDYRGVRDFYMDPDKLPGPVCTTRQRMHEALLGALKGEVREEPKRDEAFLNTFAPTKGPCSETVLRHIFR